mmetsp:Transcript_19591/g.47457  ORF Transcript_19591/g.47457 Transcript_19591/m.47457 type:complete len:462 (-) Transcript_19591:653-2038(-)
MIQKKKLSVFVAPEDVDSLLNVPPQKKPPALEPLLRIRVIRDVSQDSHYKDSHQGEEGAAADFQCVERLPDGAFETFENLLVSLKGRHEGPLEWVEPGVDRLRVFCGAEWYALEKDASQFYKAYPLDPVRPFFEQAAKGKALSRSVMPAGASVGAGAGGLPTHPTHVTYVVSVSYDSPRGGYIDQQTIRRTRGFVAEEAFKATYLRRMVTKTRTKRARTRTPQLATVSLRTTKDGTGDKRHFVFPDGKYRRSSFLAPIPAPTPSNIIDAAERQKGTAVTPSQSFYKGVRTKASLMSRMVRSWRRSLLGCVGWKDVDDASPDEEAEDAAATERVSPELMDRLDTVFGLFIVLNAIFLGIETDWRPRNVTAWDGGPDFWGWYAVQNLFCVVFLLEMLIRIWILRSRYVTDPFNFFDGCLVLLGLVDTWSVSDVADAAREPEAGGRADDPHAQDIPPLQTRSHG